jgi:hypothetical protein
MGPEPAGPRTRTGNAERRLMDAAFTQTGAIRVQGNQVVGDVTHTGFASGCRRPRAPTLAIGVVMTCPTCGGIRCINPGFCALCRDVDVRKGRGEPPRYIEASRWQRAPDHIPVDWESRSIEALIAYFDRARRVHGAPQRTVEVLVFSLRERGTKALVESATKRRLSELSDQQVIEVGNRLQRLPPEIARAWTAAEVETLFQARVKCPKALSMRV